MCSVFLNQLAICKCELEFELGETVNIAWVSGVSGEKGKDGSPIGRPDTQATVNKSSYRSGRREDLELGASGLQAIRSRWHL